MIQERADSEPLAGRPRGLNFWNWEITNDSRSSDKYRKSGTISPMEARMATAQSTLVVDLGPLRKSVEERVQSGTYASTDEVIQAGLLALEREEARLNEWLTQQALESLADPRPSVPAEQVFRDLRAKYGIPTSESIS
jgi:antitoxin ParD1/3/4